MNRAQTQTFNQTCPGATIVSEENIGCGVVEIICTRDGRKALVQISKTGQMVRGEHLGAA